MVDVIILLIVLVVIIFAIKSSIKHLKGEGSCCGCGSSFKSKDKKLDGPVLGKKNVRIDGMHCAHCAATVEGAINKIDGAACRVDLKKNTAIVSYDRTVDDATIRQAVVDAGYSVVGIN